MEGPWVVVIRMSQSSKGRMGQARMLCDVEGPMAANALNDEFMCMVCCIYSTVTHEKKSK